jgi:hypothetical protein
VTAQLAATRGSLELFIYLLAYLFMYLFILESRRNYQVARRLAKCSKGMSFEASHRPFGQETVHLLWKQCFMQTREH